MNQKQYETMIEKSCNGLIALSTGLCAECIVCQQEYDMCGVEFEDAIANQDILEEPSFSWQSCDICHTRLGGNRVSGHYVNDKNTIQHIDNVCTDCMIYIANGDIPEYGPNGKTITK